MSINYAMHCHIFILNKLFIGKSIRFYPHLENSFIFSDIKPENILIGVYGILKLGKKYFFTFDYFEFVNFLS